MREQRFDWLNTRLNFFEQVRLVEQLRNTFARDQFLFEYLFALART